MKAYIIMFLLFFSVGCSNLLKEKNLTNNEEIFFNKNKLANGKLIIKEKNGDIEKNLMNGEIKNIIINGKEYEYLDGMLTKIINRNKQVYTYYEGELVEVDDEKVISSKISSQFPTIKPNKNFDINKEFYNGVIKKISYTDINTNITLFFDGFGIIKEKIIKINTEIKYRYVYNYEGILINIYIKTNDNSEKIIFDFNFDNYKLISYLNNKKNLEKIYDLDGNLYSTLSYLSFTIRSYYEYYPNGNIKRLGYFNENMDKIGRWTYFYKTGNTMEFIEYSHENIAYFNKYYENGIKMLSGKLKIASNKYIGEIKEYYLNGQLKAVEQYSEEGKIVEGKSKYFDEKGFETIKVN